MKSALVQRLVKELGYPTLGMDTLDAFLRNHECTALFFSGDPAQYPESDDVAVVLPELVHAFGGRFTPALIAEEDEAALQALYGFRVWPALVFLRRDRYLGTICKIQDWNDYLEQIEQLLTQEPTRPPSVGIPLVSA